MESGALRRLSGSLTTLLWDLYDRPLHRWAPKMLFHGLLHSHGPGADCPLLSPALSHKPWVGESCSVSFVSLTFSWDDLFYNNRAKNAILVKSCQFRSASRSKMSSDCTPGIACDKFSPAHLWPRKIAAPLNKISLICKNRLALLEFTLLVI